MMKRALACIICAYCTQNLYALPLGNPADASLLQRELPSEECIRFCDVWSVRIGYWDDTVYERHLEVVRTEASDSIDRTTLKTCAGFLALNFYEKIDLFATLGETSFGFTTNASSFRGTPGALLDLSTRSHFSWSAGARITLWDCGPFALGAEAQYFYTRPTINRITLASQDAVYPSGTLSLRYQEWQVGMGAAYKVGAAVPYIGMKWSTVRVGMDYAIVPIGLSEITLYNLQDDLDFGYVIGFSYTVCSRWDFTVEWRFADERALFFNMQLRV